MNRIATPLLSLALGLALAACGSSDKKASKTSIATTQAGDLTVEILADSALEVGLTSVYLKVTDASGATVVDATVTFMPMMTMTTMSHGAPVIAPPALEGGLYRCDVVFQMAGSWSAKVGVARPAAAPVEASFPDLAVAETGRARSFTSGTSKYVFSMSFEAPPKVGLNPVLVTLHETRDMGMTFTPVDDATFVLDPQMPSMGHGSPGSVDPTPISLGRYRGQLSFSMPGAWETTVTVNRSGFPAPVSVEIQTTF